MKNVQKVYRKTLIGILSFSLVVLASVLYLEIRQQEIPDKVSVFAGETYSFDESGQQAFSNENIGNYEVDYKLFGLFPIKTVSVDVVERQVVIPCGIPAGIYVETEGILVVGHEEVTTADGSKVNPTETIVKKGDYITSVNGEEVNRKADLMEAVEASGGEQMVLGIRRNEEEFEVAVQPVECAAKEYKLGVWVRDNTQGIGTITYITPEGNFGALGHGISDMDTKELLDTSRGLLYDTKIMTVIKGQEGKPGELVGYIDYQAENVQGRIDKNTSEGIYGVVNDELEAEATAQHVQVCLKQDIEVGPATIQTCIADEVKEYDVEIEAVNLSEKEENKGLILKVTDKELLSETGGIVQGMSGAPILQNGKIIGAVTHVFVEDPTMGYGIFIEEMLKESENSGKE